jgi:hypothetical protein
MGQREIARLNFYGDHLQATTSLNDQQITEIVNGRPAPREEIAWHEKQFRLLKSDAELTRKYLAGDLETRQRFDPHIIGRKMRPGTPQQIAAWEKVHGKSSRV